MSVISGSEIYYDAVKYDGGSNGACDALAAFRDAKIRRSGKGFSTIVTTSRDGAETILDYCETVGVTFAGETEPETRADARALLAVAERIRRELS